MTVLALLWCLSGSCEWVEAPNRWAVPMGCFIEAQQIAASYVQQHGGEVRRYRCGRPERRA